MAGTDDGLHRIPAELVDGHRFDHRFDVHRRAEAARLSPCCAGRACPRASAVPIARLIGSSPAKFIGYVRAPDAKSAVEMAIKDYAISNRLIDLIATPEEG
jgi:hypothetical protein